VRLEELFDDMGGKFEATLRQLKTNVRTWQGRGESIAVSSRVALLEARFDLEVLDRLHEPCFVGVERRLSGRSGSAYVIYEVTAVKPTHFQMLAMNTSLPTVIRKEYLDTIYGGWGQSDETWVDVQCAPTGYMLVLVDGKPRFEKTTLTPLIGAPAHLLSQEATKMFLCVEGGAAIGTVIGFNVELTVDIESLIKYHVGVFGFTGSGKSNLTSTLIRHALSLDDEGTVVVFDVAGEYAVNLADILETGGEFYTTEELADPDSFLESQTIPETLEAKITQDLLRRWAETLYDEGHVKRLHVEETLQPITISYALSVLNGYAKETKTGAMRALMLASKIDQEIHRAQIDPEKQISELPPKLRKELEEIISETQQKLNDRSTLYSDLSALIEALQEAPTATSATSQSKPSRVTPEALAGLALSRDAPPLIVIYVPDPRAARKATAEFLSQLLQLKKHGGRRRVTVVFDEAQEFIPYETRKEDYTAQSSLAVESLLRQGRKYRAHCILATQRIAHLNTNALQQLHSYFVSTMPRYYDRIVIAEAFSLDYGVLERTTQLDTGQWLFVSFKSTRQKNVPVFIQTPNNEDKVAEYLGLTAK